MKDVVDNTHSNYANNSVWDKKCPVIIDQNKKTTYIYISNNVEEPNHYNEVCYVIENSPEDFQIRLNINTPGGIVDSAFMIANSITKSSSKVIGVLSGTVASAGTLISMACHELEIDEHLTFMIHNYSGGIAGKGHEMKARQQFLDNHLNVAFKSFYSGFLSTEEMDSVIEGADLWMGANEVKDRWKKRIIYLDSF